MRIKDPRGFDNFRSMLKSCGLPADDLDLHRDLLFGYYEGTRLLGTGALEIRGPFALLRSLSVQLGTRGKNVGTKITDELLSTARSMGIKAVFLLTETAAGFFVRKGFVTVRREDVPDEIKATSEFMQVCPDSAVVMCIVLDQA